MYEHGAGKSIHGTGWDEDVESVCDKIYCMDFLIVVPSPLMEIVTHSDLYANI